MFKKLDDVESRFNELSQLLADPNVTSQPKQYTSYMKEYSTLGELVKSYQEYKKIKSEFDATKKMMETEDDQTLKDMAKEELPQLEKDLKALEEALKVHLLPKDPNDDKNILVEIRSDAGGDEAALFAESLFTMYSKYALKNNWSVEIMSMGPGNMGGFKEVIFGIRG